MTSLSDMERISSFFYGNRSEVNARKHDVLGRNMIGQPDAIIGYEELISIGVHLAGKDLQNDGLPSS